MKTRLLYLGNTYAFEYSAELIAIEVDGEGSSYLVLDSTIFYPQGGGQPSDIGEIRSSSGCLQVVFVRNVEGQVRHYVEGDVAGLEPGQTLMLLVNKEKRLMHARAHTAGHMLVAAASTTFSEWRAVKGHHFPDGCYVEFEGVLDREKDLAIEELNQALSSIVAQNVPVAARIINGSGLREVQVGLYDPVLCGGTHSASTSEVGPVSIRTLKAKKEIIRVGYQCELV